MRYFYLLYMVFIFFRCSYSKEADFLSKFHNNYNHYFNNEITRFKICGERCSGTNFLSRLIANNFFNLSEEVGYGHKHALYWFNEPINEKKLEQLGYSIKDVSLYKSEDCLFIVVIREPYDWLRSFYLNPHQVHKSLLCRGFLGFISSEWRVTNQYPALTQIDNLNPITNLPFRNVLELRKYKTLNYLKLGELVENYLLVKYEDVRDDPRKFIQFVSKYYNIKKKEKFVPITTYKDTKLSYKEKKYFKFSKRQLEFINNNLDWNIENSIGFRKLTKAIDFVKPKSSKN